MAENSNSSVTEKLGLQNSSVLPLKNSQNSSVLQFFLSLLWENTVFMSLLKLKIPLKCIFLRLESKKGLFFFSMGKYNVKIPLFCQFSPKIPL